MGLREKLLGNRNFKNLFRLPGSGRKLLLTFEEESKVINWIKQNREFKIVIITFSIILFIQKIKSTFSEAKLHAQKELVHIFFSKEMILFSENLAI